MTIDFQRLVLIIVAVALFTIAGIGMVNKFNRKQDANGNPALHKTELQPGFQMWTGNDYPLVKGVTYG